MKEFKKKKTWEFDKFPKPESESCWGNEISFWKEEPCTVENIQNLFR